MAKDNQFQHKVSALAKPHPNRADPLKDAAYHEPQIAPERALITRRSQADEVLRTDTYPGPPSDLGKSQPCRSCADCIIVTRGYDFREGHRPGSQPGRFHFWQPVLNFRLYFFVAGKPCISPGSEVANRA